MDDKAKNASSFQIDQEVLDARGIGMTVEEVAGLSTVRYSEKVQSLSLNDEDLAFLKSLRRRIKNRLASQNSRRRNMEHLRLLSRELRVLRKCKGAAVTERRALAARREAAAARLQALTTHVEKVLSDRSDPSPLPSDVTVHTDPAASPPPSPPSPRDTPTPSPPPSPPTPPRSPPAREADARLYGSRTLDATLKSLLMSGNLSKVCAKTVFIPAAEGQVDDDGGKQEGLSDDGGGVLNLSVKNGRRSHGRKQSAPKRIAYAFCDEEAVLDLKVKKECQ